MNPLILHLLDASLKYAFDLIERRQQQLGRMPTYEEVWAEVESEIGKALAEGEAWKKTHPHA